MTPEETLDLVRELKRDNKAYKNWNKRFIFAVLNYLDKAYHNRNASPISDTVYDTVYGYAKQKYPKDVHWKKVGAEIEPRNGIVKIRLPAFMPSLDKMRTVEDTNKFISGSVVVSDKLDGISLLAQYKNGELQLVTTRGDGKTGQNISGVIPALRIPQYLKYDMVVRLEFIIPHKTFLSEYHSDKKEDNKFKTARNMGGGLLTRNRPNTKVKAFSCVAYDIIDGEYATSSISNKLEFLERAGFEVVYYKKIDKPSFEQLEQHLATRLKRSRYELDGLVVTKNISTTPARTLQNPKHSKAFKVNSLEAAKVVIVKDIEWNKSRYGKIIPRVVVEPVELGGVTVQYFTGHNAFFINNGYKSSDKHLNKIKKPINVGATLRVIRSGDVIPYIMEVVKPSRTPSKPDVPYILDSEGVHYLSTENNLDHTVRMKRLVHFFTSLGIEGVKAGVIKKLMDAGYYTLKKILNAKASDFAEIEGFQERSAKTLYNNIQEGIKSATFVDLATGSGVFGDKIGKRKLQEIYNKFPDIMDMSDLNPVELEEHIRSVRGFAKLSKQIAEALPKFKKFLDTYGLHLVEKSTVNQSNRLTNLKVLFTSFRDAQLAKFIEENGGEIASTVRKANIVLVKDGSVSNKKTEDAAKLNIPVISVKQFKEKWKL